MQAAVAVLFWVGDIVLAADESDVILADEGIGNAVDIIDKGTDDTYAGDIEKIGFDGGCADRIVA